MTFLRNHYSRVLAVSALCSAALVSQFAIAAPTVQQVSGKFDHKASVTISGSGFGTKGTAAPVIWDDASGASIRDKWDGAWPNCGSTNYYTRYTAPINGMPLPHSHITKYIAGAHGDNADQNGCGPYGGYNVIFWKTRTISTYPAYTYVSWYHRAANNWTFVGEFNYKSFAFSTGNTPYNLPYNWYTAYGPPHPNSNTDGAQWLWTDDAIDAYKTLLRPDLNGHSNWWDSAVNPMAGQWAKVEMEIKYTNQNDGYIKLWENGQLRMNYLGPTDKYAGNPLDGGPMRTEGIGGYSNAYKYSTNFRYFADVYLDYSRARVVLANNSDLSKATMVETQVPTSWADGGIGVSVNLGKFTSGQTAYLFVFDSSGVRNSSGLAVTVGGTAAAAPKPPTAVSAQ